MKKSKKMTELTCQVLAACTLTTSLLLPSMAFAETKEVSGKTVSVSNNPMTTDGKLLYDNDNPLYCGSVVLENSWDTGIANENNLTITGGNFSQSTIAGGNVIIKYAGIGTAVKNKLTINAGYFDGAIHSGNAEIVTAIGAPAYAGNKATANSNTLNINTDISAEESQRTFRGDIAGGYADTRGGTAQANENIVTVTGGKFISYNNVHISGGWARSIETSSCIAQANSNTIELKNIIIDVRFGPALKTGEKDKKGNWIYRGDGFLTRSIFGGYATSYTDGTAIANDNKLTISGDLTNIVIMPHATINNPDKGYSESVVFAGYALNGTANEANNNTLTINGGRINGYSIDALKAEHGTDFSADYDGTYNDYLNDSNYTVEMEPTTYIGGGFAVEGTANNNKVIISGGTIGSTGRIINVYGAHRAVLAKGNEVTINGSPATITGNVAGAYLSHVNTEKIKNITLEQNKVTISAGNVNGMVAGADGCTLSTIKGNEVIISGGTVNGKIYGGFGESGSHEAVAEGNKLTITGGSITGDVHGGYVDDENGSVAKNNTVIIEGGTITGNVFGGGTCWDKDTPLEQAKTAFDNTVILGAADNSDGKANITGNVYINGVNKYDWRGIEPEIPSDLTGGTLNVYNTGNTVTGNVYANEAKVNFHVKNTDIGNTTSLLTVHNAGNTADMQIKGATVNAVYTGALGAGSVKLLTADNITDDSTTSYAINGHKATLNERSATLIDKTAFSLLSYGKIEKAADGKSLVLTTEDSSWGAAGTLNGAGKSEAVLTDAASVTKGAGAYSDGTEGAAKNASGGKITVNSGSFANIYGGYSVNGDAAGNTVNINGGTVTNVYGGYSEASGVASGNVININGGTVTNIYSGQSTDNSNIINVKGGTVTGTVEGEQVNVSDGKIDTGAAVNAADVAISGGAIASGASVTASNGVSITGGTVANGATITASKTINMEGGSVSGALNAETVDLKGGTINSGATIAATDGVSITGGIIASGTSVTATNEISVAGGSVAGKLDTKTLILNSGIVENTAEIYATDVKLTGTATINAEIAGLTQAALESNYDLKLGAGAYESVTVNDGNALTLSGATVKDAKADKVSATGGTIGTINSTTAEIGGATVTTVAADKVAVTSGTVTAIQAKDTAAVSGGTVEAVNATNNVSVTGGTISAIKTDKEVLATGGTIGAITSDVANINGATVTESINANTINLNKLLGTPKVHISGASTVNLYDSKQTLSSLTSETGKGVLNFYIPAGLAGNTKGSAMLLINGEAATNLNGWTVNAGVQADVKYNNNDKVVLLHNEKGITTEGIVYGKLTSGVSTVYTAKMVADENSITATIVDKNVSEQAKSFLETQAANIAILNGAADLMAGQGFENAAAAVAQAQPAASRSMVPFIATAGNSIRSNSGSYVDTRGVNFALGMAKSVKNGSGKLIFGPMIEYGRGNYASHLDDGTRGDGTSKSWGLGMFAKQENANGIYYEGSIRAGAVKADYRSAEMGSYEFDAPYVSLHAGMGRNTKVGKSAMLDVYGKYFYSHQNSDDVNIHTVYGDESYNFGSVNSSRMRLGTRWSNQISENSQFYLGAALQYEFSGKASATYQDMTAPSPSVKGASGMYELGWKSTNKNGSSVDLNLTGWSGKQQGLSLGARFNWAF